ncbi:MAG: phosphoribosylglycinamide formyltransferase [Flavobacterium sp.]
MKNILIFASGSGSNAENIIQYFQKNDAANVQAVFTNNSAAKVIDRAQKLNVPAVVFSKTELSSADFLQKINSYQPDLIVLAGFLLKFPENIIEIYPNKIINIHPALLPNYGGKGMYGMNVHQAVLENKEKETGITIHYVNENYDEGEFIFQKSVNIENCQTADEIAEKINTLEMENFPQVIDKLLNSSTQKS